MPADAKTKHSNRGQQPYTSGLGKVFTSPTKRRNKHKSTTLVAPIGLNMRQKRLLDDIRRLKALPANTGAHACSESDTVLEGQPPKGDPESFNHSLEPICAAPLDFESSDPGMVDATVSLDPTLFTKSRRTLPDATAHELYNRWMTRLPTLVLSLSVYVTRTTGVHLEPVTELKSTCLKDQRDMCHWKSSNILCLFFDRKLTILTSKCLNSLSVFQILRALMLNHVNVSICSKSWYPTVSSPRHRQNREWPYPSVFSISTMHFSSDLAMLLTPWLVRYILTIHDVVLSFSTQRFHFLFLFFHKTDLEICRVIQYRIASVEVWDMPYSGMTVSRFSLKTR